MSETIHRFENAAIGLQFAQRKARFGHREWLFWHLDGGAVAAALRTLDTFDVAMAEAKRRDDRPLLFFVGANDGNPWRAGNGQLEIVRRNLASGHV